MLKRLWVLARKNHTFRENGEWRPSQTFIFSSTANSFMLNTIRIWTNGLMTIPFRLQNVAKLWRSGCEGTRGKDIRIITDFRFLETIPFLSYSVRREDEQTIAMRILKSVTEMNCHKANDVVANWEDNLKSEECHSFICGF